jgi:exopolysaccharide biosynthesis polyprenyl glycosylphosphotransferase
VLFLHLALFLTLIARYGNSNWMEKWNSHWPKFIAVFIFWLLGLYLNNFYNLNLRANSRKFFRALGSTAIFSSFLSIIYFYLATETDITPKTNLLIFFGFFSVLLIAWRQIYHLILSSVIVRENLALIGFNHKTEKLLEEIRKNPGAGYGTALIFKSAEEIKSLTNIIKDKNIKTIVICDDFGQSETLREALFTCLNLNLNFFNYPDFYEYLSGKVPVETIDANWFLENIKEGDKAYFNSLKNVVDFVAALLILIISLPFWPFIALIVKLESRGPVFFKQVRTGRHEHKFMMLKFRTMKEGDNNRAMTLEGDKRITRFGNFLRKTRIDEIPQIINILKGDMSFIGPRPERPEFIATLEKEIPFYKTRLLVKPGLSGWDQVSGEYHSPSSDDTLKKLQNDLFYIKNRSLYLDGIIVLKTMAAVLSRGGR